MKYSLFYFSLLCITLLCLPCHAEEAHGYEQNERVMLYANKVGPYSNPQEMYMYYDHLPFCKPKEEVYKKLPLGEVLQADRLRLTDFNISFRSDVHGAKLCSWTVSGEDKAKLKKAIEREYFFEFVLDNIPFRGFIGEKYNNGSSLGIFIHYLFTISYNDNHVIDVEWSYDPDSLLDVSDTKTETSGDVLYSVKWVKTNTPYRERHTRLMELHAQNQQLEVHWFSIFNSFITVILLTGFLATILLRVLKNDFLRYSQEDDDEALDKEETGWKLLHADVFRFPANPSLFSAVIGNGMHILSFAFCMLVLAVVGVFYPNSRGSIYTAAVVSFSLTSFFQGLASSVMYKKLDGEKWVRNLLLTTFLIMGPVAFIGAFLNFTAVAYNSPAALPFGTIVALLAMWLFLNFPLSVIGGITGRRFSSAFDAPCRTSHVVREVPSLPWYRSGVTQVVIAGFLPFSAIYIELYYIFASVWGHKLYTIYGILFLIFILLLIVTSFITVALTYFQLAVEDHRWWWRSLFVGGSTGFFVMGYSVYYFFTRSQMSGFMQVAWFFGSMSIVCFGFFLSLGTVGFMSSLLFVKYIYKVVKID